MIKKGNNRYYVEVLKSKKFYSTILSLSMLVMVYSYWYVNDGAKVQYITASLYIIVPLFYPLIIENRTFVKWLLFFFWLPAGLWAFMTGLTTFSSIWSRTGQMTLASYLSILFASIALYEAYHNTLNLSRWKRVYGSIAISAPFLMIVLFGYKQTVGVFKNMYLESGYEDMTAVVSRGPYKYIHSSPERVRGIEETQDIVDNYIEKDDNVLFMDCSPFGYMMTEATPCTPSTWDIALFSYGLNNPSGYFDYFEMIGRYPDKIFYIDDRMSSSISLDNGENLLTIWVEENYELLYTSDDTIFRMYVYKKIA